MIQSSENWRLSFIISGLPYYYSFRSGFWDWLILLMGQEHGMSSRTHLTDPHLITFSHLAGTTSITALVQGRSSNKLYFNVNQTSPWESRMLLEFIRASFRNFTGTGNLRTRPMHFERCFCHSLVPVPCKIRV
jgi:hypothetical protein